jgi:hypothetical protein
MTTLPAFLILGLVLVFLGTGLVGLFGATIILWMEVLDEFRRRRLRKRFEQESGR